jgi:putative transposase
VAVEASSTKATIAELATKYQLHPNQIYAWEKQLLDGALRHDRPADSKARFFIPEVRTMSRAERVAMIDLGHAGLSVRRQCAPLRLARAGIYRRATAPDLEELTLTRWIDAPYLATPFYGSRRMSAGLPRAGRQANRKRFYPLDDFYRRGRPRLQLTGWIQWSCRLGPAQTSLSGCSDGLVLPLRP